MRKRLILCVLKTEKIFLSKLKKDDGFEGIKEKKIERLELKTEENCKSVREILKAEKWKREIGSCFRNG